MANSIILRVKLSVFSTKHNEDFRFMGLVWVISNSEAAGMLVYKQCCHCCS